MSATNTIQYLLAGALQRPLTLASLTSGNLAIDATMLRAVGVRGGPACGSRGGPGRNAFGAFRNAHVEDGRVTMTKIVVPKHALKSEQSCEMLR